MGFQEAFGDIFQRIFGSNFGKPRIKKIGNKWECATHDGKRGHGVTPRMAYGAWAALRDAPTGGYVPRQQCGPESQPPRNP